MCVFITDRKIVYLRRSYLQHRYARKTQSHSSGKKPPLQNGHDLPDELIQPTDGHVNSTYMDSTDQTAVDNIGFTSDSGEVSDQILPDCSKVFTISDWEDIKISTEKQQDFCIHKYINGTRAVEVDSLTSVNQEINPNDLNFTTESTWL